MLISVIICAYSMSRYHDLAEAISSLIGQSAEKEVILVIDRNEELHRLAVSELGGNGVRVLLSKSPGLSSGRNLGLSSARGDIVAFMDDDAVAGDGWLAALEGAFADPNVVVAGGTIKPMWLGNRKGWMPNSFMWVVGCTGLDEPENGEEVRNAFGSNIAFRKAALVEAGGFSGNLGRVDERQSTSEEVSACIAVKRNNPLAKIIHVRGAEVSHRVYASRATPAFYLRRAYGEGASKAKLRKILSSGSKNEGLSKEIPYLMKTMTDSRDTSGAKNLIALFVSWGLTASVAMGFFSGRWRGPHD